jgi:hypothetical protein
MWHIHGKKYDLTNFLDHHPGGKDILEACRGNQDCTASFESYHTFCDMEKIKKIMKKYEVLESDTSHIKPVETPFLFEPNGFFRTVQRKVRGYFCENKISHYANFSWLIKVTIQILIYVISLFISFYTGVNFWLRPFFCRICGAYAYTMGIYCDA